MSKGQNIGYIRVSTVEQNSERQLDGIELHKTFTDKCSGKDTNRPQLSLMLEFIRDGDTLYVHSMDRLARNLDDLRSMVNKLAAKGVTIKFVKEGLTFNGQETPMATLMLSVMGAFAEFEKSLISERQKEGIALAKKTGKYRGRSKCFTDTQLSEIQQMLKDRYKKVEIAEKFGVSRNTLHRYLKNVTPIAIDEQLNQASSPVNKLKTIKILLRLIIENNSKWVRGKKKTYEDIEMFTLPYYKFIKTKNEHEYILTFEYENNVDLDEQIDGLHSELWSHADSRNCFIDDTSISTLDKEKYWY